MPSTKTAKKGSAKSAGKASGKSASRKPAQAKATARTSVTRSSKPKAATSAARAKTTAHAKAAATASARKAAAARRSTATVKSSASKSSAAKSSGSKSSAAKSSNKAQAAKASSAKSKAAVQAASKKALAAANAAKVKAAAVKAAAAKSASTKAAAEKAAVVKAAAAKVVAAKAAEAKIAAKAAADKVAANKLAAAQFVAARAKAASLKGASKAETRITGSPVRTIETKTQATAPAGVVSGTTAINKISGKPIAPSATESRPAAAAPVTQHQASSEPSNVNSTNTESQVMQPAVSTAGVAPQRPAGSHPLAHMRHMRPGALIRQVRPTGVKVNFKPHEYVVYPAHGVGQITAVEEQEVAGFKLELFVISFIKDKMILKVPTPKVASVGMRKLSEVPVVEKALMTLTGRARIKRTMWSRRAQEYEAKINSGDLGAIAEVVRDLYRSDAQPEQSYSERQLFEAATDRMGREIAIVRKITEHEAFKLIESQLQKGPRRGVEKADAEAGEGEPEADVEEAA